MRSCRPFAATAGFPATAVRLALDDEIVGVAGEAIDRALGADRIGEGGEPCAWSPVRGRDNRADPVALGQQLVDVATLGDIRGVEGEVVKDEQVDGDCRVDLWGQRLQPWNRRVLPGQRLDWLDYRPPRPFTAAGVHGRIARVDRRQPVHLPRLPPHSFAGVGAEALDPGRCAPDAGLPARERLAVRVEGLRQLPDLVKRRDERHGEPEQHADLGAKRDGVRHAEREVGD